MRKVAIYFTAPAFDDYPFDNSGYKQGYHQLGKMFEEKGLQCVIVRDQESYLGGNRFKGGWLYKNGEFERTEEEIDADVIFNKGVLKVDEDANIIASPELDKICTNKIKTYETFPDLCPRTVEVKTQEEFDQEVDSMPGTMIVAKPLDLFGGEGVIIGTKEEVKSQVKTFPYLLQEFLDTSYGIPGITDQAHDLRIIVVGNEIVSNLLRTPKPGSLISNVAQGGAARVIPFEKLPAEAMQLAQKVDLRLNYIPNRVYSIDMGLHEGRDWKIIELNCQPGLSIDDYNDGEMGKKLFESIVNVLSEAAENH